MMREGAFVSGAFVLAMLVAACSSDSSGGPGGGGSGGSAGSGGTTSTDPWVAVPPSPLVATVTSDCPAAFQTAPGAGQHGGYDAGGQSRSFYLALPAQSPTGTSGPFPLMVAFNGTGETGKAIFDRAKLQDYVDRGFIVLAPDSAGNGTVWPVWDAMREPGKESEPNADIDLFDSLVKCVAAHHGVDEKRIYISGHSAGGIFVNAVMQRRSDLLAGGIPASSIFDLTAPSPAAPLGDVFVIVTWGGDNDSWGGSANGVTVPKFNFVEQAAIASEFYEQNAEQVYCKGKSLGHAWLGAANTWMIDALLAHPKGLAKNENWTFTAPDATANYECGDGMAPKPEGVTVTCLQSTTTGCQDYCQLIGDCAVENATVEPVLGAQLETIGFSGPGHTDCGGCLTKCEADGQSALDAGVLGCFSTAAASAVCGPGINGAYPFVDATNKCCDQKAGSQVCGTLCGAIKTNSSAMALFSVCQQY